MAKPAQVTTEVVQPRNAVKPNPPFKKLGPAAKWGDDRVGLGGMGNFFLRKIFPDHWSFMLGEIALYSFVVLLVTGIFLTIWFKPSMTEIEYQGSYQLMKGLPMSEAFASTLDISFDIRGGLLVRQIHHWAAMMFVGAMMVHALRVFFTGAFRKPREINWLLGVGLLIMGTVEGFAGYSLPDDLLSGTGLRFADGLIRSIPIVGTWVEFFLFAGEFPGTLIIPRLYMVHILLLPGLILGLVAAHLALVFYHKHSQYPGPGRTETNVVGIPMFPTFAAKAGGLFFIVSGFLTLMGTFVQINPVWVVGPYNPAQVTAGSQPDWYMGPAEGAVRIMPNWESYILGTTWSWNVAIPGLGFLGLLFVALGVYPFLEKWITGDDSEHHIVDRPRNAATRTALGVAAMSVYAMFWLSGGNDILAIRFHVSLNQVTEVMRVMVFAAPIIAFIITKRICLGLQRKDQERLLHGSETGTMMRTAEGGYYEPHLPISHDEAWTLTQHKQYMPLDATPGEDRNGLDKKDIVSKRRARFSRWFYKDRVEIPTSDEIAAARAHIEHEKHGELDDIEGPHDPELTGRH